MMDHIQQAFAFVIHTRRDIDEKLPAAGSATIDAIMAHHTTPEQAGEVFTRNAGWIQHAAVCRDVGLPSPKHHNLPHEKIAQGSNDSTRWCMTEILCNLEKGTMRAAVDGVELARYTHPTPSERNDPEKRIIAGPIGLFRHGGGASEYKDVYVEANPKDDVLITVRTPVAAPPGKRTGG